MELTLDYPLICMAEHESPLAIRLRSLMETDDINQPELARRVKNDVSTISKYLSGKMPVSDKFLRKAEEKLGWSARWIRTGEGPQRITHTHDESVRTRQSGSQNNQHVTYKGEQRGVEPKPYQPDLENELLRVKLQAAEEKIELLRQINELQQKNKLN